MNLIKRNFDHVPELFKQVLEARFNSPQLKNVAPLDGKKFIKDVLQKMFFDAGQIKDVTDNVLTVMTKSLYADIKNTFFNVTLLEIKIGLESGVRGEFKEKTGNLFGGVTIINCIHWLRAYLESEKVIEGIKFHLMPAPYEEIPFNVDGYKKGLSSIKDTLNQIIKEQQIKNAGQKKEVLPLTMSPQQIEENLWLIEFDKLQQQQGNVLDNGVRFVIVDGKHLTVTDFMMYKLKNKLYGKQPTRTSRT